MMNKNLMPSIVLGFLLVMGAGATGYALHHANEYNRQFDNAYEIQNEDDLKHSSGNSFIYGELKAVDTVSLPEISGEYMYLKKIKQVYTKHKKLIPIRSGKTVVMNPSYYHSWDDEEVDEVYSKNLSIMGMTLPLSKVESLPEPEYVATIKESDEICYVYYGCPNIYTGTIYTYINDSDIYGMSKFFTKSIQDTKKELKVNKVKIVIAMIIWFIFSVVVSLIIYVKI